MNESNSKSRVDVSRRRFLARSSLALTSAAAVAQFPLVHVAGAPADMSIKIGLIGCGGRGTGAVLDALGAATKVIYPSSGYHTENVAEGTKVEKKDLKVVALADVFEDRLAACREQLAKLGIDIRKDACLTGFDACSLPRRSCCNSAA